MPKRFGIIKLEAAASGGICPQIFEIAIFRRNLTLTSHLTGHIMVSKLNFLCAMDKIEASMAQIQLSILRANED